MSGVPGSSSASAPSQHRARDDSTMRILVFTDTHLGHKDHDDVLGNDAMETFEEILLIAKENKVDFILHSGDLFDENKPSRKCMNDTFKLLSDYCMGDTPVHYFLKSNRSHSLFACQTQQLLHMLHDKLEDVGDGQFSGNIHIQVSHVDEHAFLAREEVNFYDPNYNIAIPIFMIHGNHDDPGGIHNLSANHLLSVNRLVNYFGNQPDVDDIKLGPICIEKKGTKLALYGLGNVRDERLNRTFEKGHVSWSRPTPNPDDYFNIMLIHQNRFRGNFGGMPNKQCVKEEFLPDWLNLVIWGHEHESKCDPAESKAGNYHIMQPGSSVATSYIAAEAVPKYICYLEIMGTQYKTTKVPLKTIRPFKIDEVCLKDVRAEDVDQNFGLQNVGNPARAKRQKLSRLAGFEPNASGTMDNEVDDDLDSFLDPNDHKQIWDFLTQHIEKLIALNEEEQQQKDEQLRSKKLPLIRLKVDYTDFPCNIIGNARFGQQFVGRVANPDALLLFTKKTQRRAANQRIPMLDETGEVRTDEFGNVMYFDEMEELQYDEQGNVIDKPLEHTTFDEAGDRVDPFSREAKMEQQRTMGETLFNLMPKQDYAILPGTDFNHAILNFVEKNDAGSIERFVKATIEATNQQLFSASADQVNSEVDNILIAMKQKREQIRQETKIKLASDATFQNMTGMASNFMDDDIPMDVSDDDINADVRGGQQLQHQGPAGKAKAKAKSRAKAKAGKAKSRAKAGSGVSSSGSGSARPSPNDLTMGNNNNVGFLAMANQQQQMLNAGGGGLQQQPFFQQQQQQPFQPHMQQQQQFRPNMQQQQQHVRQNPNMHQQQQNQNMMQQPNPNMNSSALPSSFMQMSAGGQGQPPQKRQKIDPSTSMMNSNTNNSSQFAAGSGAQRVPQQQQQQIPAGSSSFAQMNQSQSQFAPPAAPPQQQQSQFAQMFANTSAAPRANAGNRSGGQPGSTQRRLPWQKK
ncbi:unnamed protein product [Amoebophrya sp. A120]|nr:unnamed protein product [Amoebophrya sp. A120]|eukprot:GSA120T00000265001.1